MRSRESVLPVIQTPFVFPDDIIDELRQDETVWENYQKFSDPYKRIRIAYIEAARTRPEEFRKRLDSFIEKTRRNKLIRNDVSNLMNAFDISHQRRKGF